MSVGVHADGHNQDLADPLGLGCQEHLEDLLAPLDLPVPEARRAIRITETVLPVRVAILFGLVAFARIIIELWSTRSVIKAIVSVQ